MIGTKIIENLINQLSVNINKLVNGKQCIGYEGVNITTPSVLYKLNNIPDNATEAHFYIENTTVDTVPVPARYCLDFKSMNNSIVSTNGSPLRRLPNYLKKKTNYNNLNNSYFRSKNSPLVITGKDNISNIRFMQFFIMTPPLEVSIKVLYFN